MAPEDCTGCHLCVEICPAKDKANPRRKAINMEPQAEHRDRERSNYEFFLDLPEIDRTRITRIDTKGSQFFEPLFEYSGACAGCGETPYVKLLTQLFGDRLLIANATGCSSIYGGNLPTTPYTTNRDGRGPAWSNSLFEDNAEFGFGMRLAVDSLAEQARALLERLASAAGEDLAAKILSADAGRRRGDRRAAPEDASSCASSSRKSITPDARRLALLADYLVEKSVWIVGGDGWAYDIGYGGLDHVLASRRNVNILVLDTEVYSNTGGQASKATPLGAAAKFAAAGKEIGKKDLGLDGDELRPRLRGAGRVRGAREPDGARRFREAEAYPGPSLIIAYSHCIAHGYDLAYGVEPAEAAVDSGIWPLYRYDPRRPALGEPPLHLDSGAPRGKVRQYMQNETRFRMVEKIDPARYRRFVAEKQRQTEQRYAVYQQLAGIKIPQLEIAEDNPEPTTEG